MHRKKLIRAEECQRRMDREKKQREKRISLAAKKALENEFLNMEEKSNDSDQRN